MEQLFSEILNKLVLSALLFLNTLNSETLKIPNAGIIPENKVIRVVDGDTFEIFHEGKNQKVRMIGINTPESVDPRKEVQCFGIEASNKLKELIDGKIVRIESDETQDTKDKYGRLLRYVFLNEENINQKMISEGYAFEYTYKKRYKFYDNFKKSEENARNNNLGLWNKDNCNY